MKKTVILEICEVCERPLAGGIKHTCSVCKKEICYNCDKRDSFQHRAEICVNCFLDDRVKKVMERYNDKHWKLVHDETRALAKIKIKKIKKRGK